MRRLLQMVLKQLSRAILWKYRPVVVAVTGSVGKTSTKEAVYAVLRQKFAVRRSQGNFNTGIGVPLTIIGGGHWLAAIFKALAVIILPLSSPPQVLVLEMAADRPGDIVYLTSFVKPDVSVVTAVGPSHLEFFGALQKIAEEKANVVKALRETGVAVLNYDDEAVRGMGDKNKGKTRFYGIAAAPAGPHNDNIIFATNISYDTDGLTFKIQDQGTTVSVQLRGVLGRPAVYAALAAAGVGLALGMNLVEIAAGLRNYAGLPGRLRLLEGIKSTKIIDDTYNAAPASTAAALEVLSQIAGKRKIAVLGDMAELGQYTEDGHREVGAAVVDRGINLLVTVGPKAKFIRDQAEHMGYPEKQIMSFEDSETARKPIQSFLRPGDVVLVKGSRMMAMEKIVVEIMAAPVI